jgi:hypothetical protein
MSSTRSIGIGRYDGMQTSNEVCPIQALDLYDHGTGRGRQRSCTDPRFASTEPVTAAENISILNSQREKRPMSPHLAIYEKQVGLFI